MNLIGHPLVVFLACLALLYLAAEIGALTRHRFGPLRQEERGDFELVLGATLTLLGLIIAFTFSMAVSRYDQRKAYEEAEANAIGTEYLRADLMPDSDATRIRTLLQRYVEQRVLFYTTRDGMRLAGINADTVDIQNGLWASVRPKPDTQATPVTALVIAGMNDVLNSQGYTEAEWRNHIPASAWVLMVCIAVCCNFLIGYGSRQKDRRILLIVPISLSIAFFLISDIDSPRGGAITVAPVNLLSLAESLRTPPLPR